MKIKKISVFILIVLSIILMFLFVSCEKKNDSTINPSPDEQTQKTENLTLSVVSADMIWRRIEYYMFLWWGQFRGMGVIG